MNGSWLPIAKGRDFIAEIVVYPRRRRRHSTLEVISRHVAQLARNSLNDDMAFCAVKHRVQSVDSRGRVAVIKALYPRVCFVAQTSTHPVSDSSCQHVPGHYCQRTRQ